MLSQLPNCITRPSWLQLISWIADPLKFQDYYRQKYGDIFTMRLSGLGAFVIISDPQAIQEIFNQDPKQFDVGSGNTLAIPLLGQNSLLLMDGDRHRRERKLLMPAFHGERLQTYAKQICKITEHIASEWQVGHHFVARTAMQKISLEVILQVVFGLSGGKRYQQLQPLLAAWTNMTDSPSRSSMLFLRFLQQDWGAWTPWGQMKQRQRHIHDLLQAEIEERRTNGDAGQADVLSLIMAARDENGQAMTDEELRDELLTILFAGHETTATILAWAFYQIHQQTDVREKLLHELDSLGENPNPMEIAHLSYLTAVCQETLRLYPVLPSIFARITKSPMKIAGYRFDAETVLLPSIYLVHSREDLYPEPHQFRPERFLERQYSPSEYFPFGGGNRRCLGYALAQLEIKLVLATVVSKYQLALANDKPVKLERRGFTLAPKGGIQLVMTGKRLSEVQA
ncbi:MAG: cytochrome P450 [Leptolyngbyaceae cyanobacterium RU_5_1]|nr:cytochrome P450 [Leptolyngbyaceae cyanobacterium RU_5_1]